MKFSLLFLMFLICVTAFVEAYQQRNIQGRTKIKVKSSEDDEEQVDEQTIKKNPPKDKEADEEDDKKVWPICETAKEEYYEEDEACHCEMNGITCDEVIFEDATPLNTLMLKIKDKDFVPLTFTSRDNNFRVLSKGKIIPSMTETITELDLSRNKIWKIEKDAFYNFKNMTKLRLTGNNLRKLDPEIFKGAPERQLHKLYLNQNRFISLPNKTFSLLKNLKELVLDDARVPITKWLFEGLENLEELSLDYCQLGDRNFDVNVFDYLPNLKVLSLRGNHFTVVPRAIQSLKKLEILDLSETQITEFHKKSFKDDQSLKILYANKMPYLWSLDDCAFCDLNQLEELYLGNSPQLWNINKNAFGYVNGNKAKNVKKIDFTNCNVSTLYEETLPWGKNIELLLKGNPVKCSCETAWIFEKKIDVVDQENLMPNCNTPNKLQRTLLDTFQKTSGRVLLALVILLLASLISFTFYYLATFGKSINFLRFKARANPIYSNLSPTFEPFERDFQPKTQEI